VRRKALGRGLDALLGAKKPASAPPPQQPAEPPALPEGIDGQVRRVPLSLIVVNPEQPRTEFDPTALEELAASIRVEGVIQPILVRPNGDRYLLVAGERRLRASKLAGLDSIPALVRGVEDDRLLEIALVENIQREDLNPIEIAAALQRLAQVGQLSHEELAQRTGKDRSTVTNLLRLLRLPSEVRALVAEKRLSMGHARALLALTDEESQRKLALRAAERGLSVREVERLVREATEPPKPKLEKEIDPNVAAAVESMERRLGTRVRLVGRGGRKGRIEIDYNSPEELDRIYALLSGEGE
jgi:ParB family transcriptional regulator, chromosome partitioning protein